MTLESPTFSQRVRLGQRQSYLICIFRTCVAAVQTARVLHLCLRKALAPLSGGRQWQASKTRHHCSCLQHSARSREEASEAHDIRR